MPDKKGTTFVPFLMGRLKSYDLSYNGTAKPWMCTAKRE